MEEVVEVPGFEPPEQLLAKSLEIADLIGG
jgi:hypothetical protein